MKKAKDLKAHHHLAIVSMFCFGIISVWTWGTLVFAGNSQVTVYVGPPDACANIGGYQDEVPEGMSVDESGNCSTPTPPPIDVCDNIPDIQTAVPAGYYREISGDCLPQTTPPQDVCRNLSGTQTTVPEGYLSTPTGSCETEPKDVCSNIDGPQFPVPRNMERAADGTCYTVDPVNLSPVAPNDNGSGSGSGSGSTPLSPGAPFSPSQKTPATPYVYTDLKNVPEVLHAMFLPLVNAIPESLREALRATPEDVARTFPYYVFAVLGIASLIIGAQAFLEAQAARRLRVFLGRERAIAEEKDSFIALASHYLRTPLTLMSGSVSTVITTNEASSESVAPLQASLRDLETKISAILRDIEHNTALQSIQTPAPETTQHHLLRSTFFWIPIIAMAMITLLANFLLGVVGDIDLGTANLAAQALVMLSISALFYTAIRNRFIKVRERRYHESLVSHENAIDDARNQFIERSLLALRSGLEIIKQQKSSITGTQSSRYFDEGVNRFEHMLKKFSLLAQIQAGVVGGEEKFSLTSAIDDLIASYKSELDAKSLTIINNLTNTTVNQRRSLFDFVLSSLIDNAIKFSNNGGTIYIDSTPHEKTLSVRVTDYGPVIPQEKMSQLFKPFSRGMSAMEFNYEGLGFSLFLDKIIMDYVGGEISATSDSTHHRTTFTVKTHIA